MVARTADNNGCLDFIALRYHYEGVGVHLLNVVQADKLLNGFLNSGGKKPHMW